MATRPHTDLFLRLRHEALAERRAEEEQVGIITKMAIRVRIFLAQQMRVAILGHLSHLNFCDRNHYFPTCTVGGGERGYGWFE